MNLTPAEIRPVNVASRPKDLRVRSFLPRPAGFVHGVVTGAKSDKSQRNERPNTFVHPQEKQDSSEDGNGRKVGEVFH